MADAGPDPAPRRNAEAPDRPELVSVERPMLGGRVGIHLRPASGDHLRAAREASATLDRLEAWAARLTRFDGASELVRLNAASASSAAVGPTLAAVLDWGRTAEVATDGTVDITLLEARLAAEHGIGSTHVAAAPPPSRMWSMTRDSRGSRVHRPAGLRFDLDGVAKGWLADRALALLGRHPAVAIDADGDVAVALEAGESLELGVADPAGQGLDLLVLRLVGAGPGRQRFGVATSGTSVHRWGAAGSPRHHLIDPRTARPAATDLVQATVVASSARLAEAFAKTAVIRGSVEAPRALRRPGVLGAVLLTDDRRMVTLSGTERFLA